MSRLIKSTKHNFSFNKTYNYDYSYTNLLSKTSKQNQNQNQNNTNSNFFKDNKANSIESNEKVVDKEVKEIVNLKYRLKLFNIKK